MEDKIDSFKAFQIVFNNRVIQIDYVQSFPEFKNQTVGMLIELVLEKLSQSKEEKNINNYNLFCPCGNIIESSKLLSENICEHKYLEKNIDKNLGEKYLLIEKPDCELLNKIKENEKPLSKEEFDKIFSEKKQKETNNKKTNKPKKKDKTNSKQVKNFILTDAFKKRIKQYISNANRAEELLGLELPLFYNEDHLLKLLSMGIDEKKAKAALRIAKNELEPAVLFATMDDFQIDKKEYLYYNNDEVFDRNNINENLKNEIKKEYPFLNDEQVIERINDIFNILKKDKNNKNIFRKSVIGSIFENNKEDEDSSEDEDIFEDMDEFEDDDIDEINI